MDKQEFKPGDYWQTRLSKKKGLEGVGYAKLGKYFNHWAYKIRKNVFLNLLKKHAIVPINKKILDIGSGTGFYIDIWEKLSASDVTGLDIAKVSVENLKNIFPDKKFYVIDIGDENYNTQNVLEKYDVISCMDVLFHIVDDARFENAVKHISAHLNSGGYFIYSDNFLKKTLRGKDQVCRSKEILYKLFEQNNLEIIERKPFMWLTNSPADSKNPLLKTYWFLLEQTVSRLHLLGGLVGILLYPIELLFVRILSESPSTEIVLMKKK